MNKKRKEKALQSKEDKETYILLAPMWDYYMDSYQLFVILESINFELMMILNGPEIITLHCCWIRGSWYDYFMQKSILSGFK